MRLNVRASVVAAVVAIGLAGAVAAQAPAGGMQHPRAGGGQMGSGQMGGGQMGHGRGMGPTAQQHVEQVMAQLNLTDAQKQQIHQLMSAFHEKMQGQMQEMQKLHEQLRDQIFADAGPAGDTAAITKQIDDLQGSILQAQIELHEQVSKILDPAQRKKMREMPMPMMGMMGRGGH